MRVENLSVLVTTVYSEPRTMSDIAVGQEILGDGMDEGRVMT